MGYLMLMNACEIVDPETLETRTDSEQAHLETLQLTEAEIAELNAA